MTLSMQSKKSSSFWSEHWQKVLALVFWVSIIGAYFYYSQVTGLSTTEILRRLTRFMMHPVFGPALFILLYTVRPIFLFSAGVLSIASGAFFGPLGILWVVIGANLGALLAYVIGRYFGKGLLDDTAEERTLVSKYTNSMRERSFETIFLMRLLFLPYDFVNYLAGFLKIDWKAFLLATALGSLPGTIAFTLFGASISLESVLDGARPEFNPWILVSAVAIFLASLGVSRILRRRETNAAV